MDHLHPGRYQASSSGSSSQGSSNYSPNQYQRSWGSSSSGSSSGSSPASSSQPFQPPAALSPLEELVKRGRDVAAAPPTKSAIYDKAFALSRSTSVKRRPRPEDEPADDDDTRSIDLMGAGGGSPHDEERERERTREQVRQQRQNRQRQSGTLDAGPGPQRFPESTPQQQQDDDHFISGAFRDSVATTASFNTITGNDDRASMLGGGGGSSGPTSSVDEDVAHALSRLEARRRRDSIDTVTSSEFAEGGRWGRAWASKADDEESMYSNDDDEDDDEDEDEPIAPHLRAAAAGKVGGSAGNADWRLSESDLEGQGTALLGLAGGKGGLAGIKALGREQRQEPSQQGPAPRNGQASQPRLHKVSEPRSAQLEGIAQGAGPSTVMGSVSAPHGQYVHRYDPSSNGLRRRGSRDSIAHSIAPSVHDAGPGGYADDDGEEEDEGADGSAAGLGINRRDTIRSVVPEMGGPEEYGYGSERGARNRDSTATISAASERSAGSSGSGSTRSGQSNAHVYVWPPTPAGSSAGHGQSTAQQQQQRDMAQAQAQRARIETAPHAASSPLASPASRGAPPGPVGPSAAMARGIDSPILAPDGTRRASGSQLRQQASRTSLLKSGHPAGRLPPPTPPMGNAGYWDPNRPSPTSPTAAGGNVFGAPATQNGPPVLGKFRQKAIADRDGRESMVSDLDVETLRLDASSRRGSTSTIGSRMSVGTVRYDDETLGLDSPASENGAIPGAWPGANAMQGFQHQQPHQQAPPQPQQRWDPSTNGQQPRYAQPGAPRRSSDAFNEQQQPRRGSGAGLPQQQQQRYSLEGAHMQTPRAQTGRMVGGPASAFMDAKSQMPPPIKRSPTSQQQQQQQGPDQRSGLPKSRLSSEMGSAAASTISTNAATLAPAHPGMGKSNGSYMSQKSNASSTATTVSSASSSSPAVDTKTGPSAAEAFLTLGITHHESGDLARSAYYFERSARVEGGCVVGMCMWGMALREGWGARKDPKRGFEWISRAAARAGEMMQGSQKKSESELKAIRSELKLSVFELGKCFCYGWGVKMDKRMALEYFELAAKLGDADAQAEAGALLAAGKGGIRKDKKKAAMYYRMAEAQGYDTIGLSWIHKQSLMD